MNAILRNIILGLLLANVLLLAWKRWVVPPDTAWPERLGSESGAQLVLAKSGNFAPDPAGAQTQTVPGNLDRARCARIGPFTDADTADSIAQQLGGRGFSVGRTSAKGDIWVGYWVQLMDLKTAQDAREAVDRLVDAGLLDTYIVQTEPTYNVSLGVFRGRKGAERVSNLARGLGMNPQMMDRFSEGIQHWIKVRFREDQTLNLQDLRLDTRQILRAEDTPCVADDAMEPSREAG